MSDVKTRKNSTYLVGAIFIFFGFVILFRGILDIDIVDMVLGLWPLLLIYFGYLILKESKKEKKASTESKSKPAPEPETDKTDTRDDLSSTQFIGDTSIRLTSHNFRGGSVTSVIGDTHINLSEIDFPSGEKSISISSIIGDVYITLPKDFAFKVRGNCVIGGVHILGDKADGFFRNLSFRSEGYSEAPKRIVVDASSVIGDINIS